MAHTLELGLDSFGDVTVDDAGQRKSQAAVLRDVVQQGVLADQVGVDVLGLGEHHRDDFAISAPEVVLAAIASCTTRLRLGSAVTVLSSDDPVRVFERFATLDGISNGRAEVILGRGSFTESFPLFGYDLADYERLFEEKVALFVALLAEEPVTWRGTTRAPLDDQRVFPTTASGRLDAWIGVGGNPASVARAAHLGLPLMVAIIGGEPRRFRPLVDRYRHHLEALGQPANRVGVHSPGHVADTDEQALEELWPHMRVMRDRIGAERGWGRIRREDFERDAGPDGAWYVGSPETVARKIAATVVDLDLDRFDLKYSGGTMPMAPTMRSIELYGTAVIPMVRDMLGRDAPSR